MLHWICLLQVVPVGAFLDPCWHTEGGHARHSCDLHQLALQVYSQCRAASSQNSIGKSLTNFGMSAGRQIDVITMVGASSAHVYLNDPLMLPSFPTPMFWFDFIVLSHCMRG